MTYRVNQIQELITDIDTLLSQQAVDVSPLALEEKLNAKNLLTRVRQFLVQEAKGDIPKSHEKNDYDSDSVSQYLKTELSALIEPLQAEITAMMDHRAALSAEIQELEQRKLQNYSLSQQWANQEQMIAEFMQVLISRILPENTTPDDTLFGGKSAQEAFSGSQSNLSAAEKSDLLIRLGTDLDQHLLSLDKTVNILFEGLQRNLNTYDESLGQALAKIHSKGMQAQQLVEDFVKNISKYLQPESLVDEQKHDDVGESKAPESPPSIRDIPTDNEVDLVDLVYAGCFGGDEVSEETSGQISVPDFTQEEMDFLTAVAQNSNTHSGDSSPPPWLDIFLHDDLTEGDAYPLQPPAADTISSLNDLFVDVDAGETRAIVSPPEERELDVDGAGVYNLDVQLSALSKPQPEPALDFSPTAAQNTVLKTGNVARGIDSDWYLGVDVGTTGISAVVLNHSTGVVYPIYWCEESQRVSSAFPPSFRLPAEVYLPSGSVPGGDNSYSIQLKPYLHLGVPYRNSQQKWAPVVQFNEFAAGPLIWVVRSLTKLLLTLKSDGRSTAQGLVARAVGLDDEGFDGIMNNLAGVICNLPFGCSEQYRSNLKQALVHSLVTGPQQLFFIGEGIASILSRVNGINGQIIYLSDHDGNYSPKNQDYHLSGNTLLINIGASTTEMVLVNIPDKLHELSHQDFAEHSYDYAGNSIEQDIICQLIWAPTYREKATNKSENGQKVRNIYHWQDRFSDLDEITWQNLRLGELNLPQVGKPDLDARILLQRRLQSSLLGQALLDAAAALKLILQRQDAFTLELADWQWVLHRHDLETQVFAPFLQELNQEVDKLLLSRHIAPQPPTPINQVILSGGGAGLEIVSQWLKQKFPSSEIILDSYVDDKGFPDCSPVAYGLAMLPLHPQILLAFNTRASISGDNIALQK